MKIVVCIKQVPDTKGGVKFNPDGTLDRAAMMTIMNPDDKAGLEAMCQSISRGTCFPCTASTFTPRIDTHHGGT